MKLDGPGTIDAVPEIETLFETDKCGSDISIYRRTQDFTVVTVESGRHIDRKHAGGRFVNVFDNLRHIFTERAIQTRSQYCIHNYVGAAGQVLCPGAHFPSGALVVVKCRSRVTFQAVGVAGRNDGNFEVLFKREPSNDVTVPAVIACTAYYQQPACIGPMPPQILKCALSGTAHQRVSGYAMFFDGNAIQFPDAGRGSNTGWQL